MKETPIEAGIDTRIAGAFTEWADSGSLPDGLARGLHDALRRRSMRERLRIRLKWAAIAAPAVALMLAVSLAMSPVAAAWAVQLPVVGGFIARFASEHRGWVWAEENGFLQGVAVTASDNGYTLQVDSVLADPVQTTVFWSVQGDHPAVPNFHLSRNVRFNGARFVTHTGMTATSADGIRNDELMGSLTFDPLPADKGILELTATEIGGVKGNWRLRVAVDRSRASELTTAVDINQELELAGGRLTVGRLTLAPAQAMIDVRWTGPALPRGARLTYPALEIVPGAKGDRRDAASIALLGPDGTPAGVLQGVSGNGGQGGEGLWQSRWTLLFDRIDQLPEKLTLHLGGLIYVTDEMRVPLNKGKALTAADGRALIVADVTGTTSSGSLTVEYADIAPGFPYEGWHVIDQHGIRHEPTDVGGTGSQGRARYVVSWNLPAGLEATELACDGYWQASDFGTVTFDTRK